MPLSESDIIQRFFSRDYRGHPNVMLGVGDDAAVLSVPPDKVLAVAVDSMVAGVHFPENLAARDIGYRALAVNLSDLAAMGATPLSATLALTVPEAQEEWLEEFANGFFELAEQYRVALIGGDTTRGPLTVTVEVHGLLPRGRVLKRSGASPGDLVCVTGSLGDAAAGVRLYRGALDAHPARDYLRRRLARPEPRVQAGCDLLGVASAAIDVSDGLLIDLERLTAASGVGAVVELEKLPLSNALAETFPNDARELALTGGDDYELCFTIGNEHMPRLDSLRANWACDCSVIGEIVADSQVICKEEGVVIQLPRHGFDHFRTS